MRTTKAIPARRVLVFLGLIVAVQLAISLHQINTPFTQPARYGKSSTRAMIARNYAEGGFRLFHPQLDLLPEPGYYASELQVVSFLAALVYRVVGIQDWVGRAASLLFALATTPLLFLLIRRFYGDTAALFGAAIFALAPLNLYYGRTFQQDAAAVFFMVGTVLFFTRWVQDARHRDHLLAAACCGAMLLIKPYLAVLGLPLAYLSIARFGGRWWREWRLWAFIAVAVGPAIGWFFHIGQINSYPGTVGLDSVLERVTLSRIFNPAILLQESKDLAQAVTPIGALLLIAGFIGRSRRKYESVFHLWAVSLGILFFLFNEIQVHHEYYLMVWAPLAGVFAARAWSRIRWPVWQRKWIRWVAVVALTAAIAGSALLWFQFLNRRFRYPSYAERRHSAGVLADRRLPQDALVVTEGIDVLYYCNRKGWRFWVEGTVLELPRLLSLVKLGADYIVLSTGFGAVSPEVAAYLSETRQLVAEDGDAVRIYALKGD